MKRLIIFALLSLVASFAFAQEATLATPITTPNLTTVRVFDFDLHFRTNTAAIHVVLVNSADGQTVERSAARFDIEDNPATSPANEFRAFLGCIEAAQTGETGSNERVFKFRLLKCAQSYGTPQLVGATITP